jgi:DNA-binding MarR family transcriptional regulator
MEVTAMKQLIKTFGDAIIGVTNGRYIGKTQKQQSGMTTRAIRLLRDHGVLRRLPKRHRYRLTPRGRQLVTALQAALAASTEELTAIAA